MSSASQESDDWFDASLRLADVDCSVAEQIKRDEDMRLGMNVFLDNKILESRLVFARQSRTNPYYLLGVAGIETLAAALSLEKVSIDKVRAAPRRARCCAILKKP